MARGPLIWDPRDGERLAIGERSGVSDDANSGYVEAARSLVAGDKANAESTLEKTTAMVARDALLEVPYFGTQLWNVAGPRLLPLIQRAIEFDGVKDVPLSIEVIEGFAPTQPAEIPM